MNHILRFHDDGPVGDMYDRQVKENLSLDLTEISDHHDRSTKMTLSLAYVSVLKRRPDAVRKCDKNLKDEDTEFKRKIVKEVGCIPKRD